MSVAKAHELSELCAILRETTGQTFTDKQRLRQVYWRLQTMWRDETTALELGCLNPGARGYLRQELTKLASTLAK